MDIFLMFIFNIFTGAVIFLILSLKIEKTSATFQEKKLRREMGEIITEFNSTAERNISLLESRIAVLKKLMNENGSLKGIDFTVMDDKMTDNAVVDKYPGPSDANGPRSVQVSKTKRKVNADDIVSEMKREKSVIDSFMDKIQSMNSDEETDSVRHDAKQSGYIEKEHREFKTKSVIERNINDFPAKKSRALNLIADEEIVLTYNDINDNSNSEKEIINIEQLFNDADDKYLLIARLFSEGHSIEDLSRYSGIPSGEIKLVISLNS